MSQNQRLNASITIGAVLEGSVKKNIGILKSGLSSIGGAIKDVERRQRELAKQRKTLEKQGQSVEELDREYQDLERTLQRLRRAQERWNAAAAASRRVGAAWSSMVSDIGRKARTLSVAVGAAGAAIFGLASSTAALGDNVAKTADKIGIGIESLQEHRYAAERSGVATATFDTALEKMQKNLGEAATGTGTAKDALEQLGLSAADLVEMSPDAALGVIADAMGGVATQAEKAAIANDIFGRSGIGMLNMIRDGSRGLAVLREDARRTGYVLSEEAARDAEVFQDTLLDLQLVGKGLKNTIGSELMPAATRAMRGISDWLVGHRPEVKAWAASFADGVEAALPKIFELAAGLARVGDTVGRMVGRVAEFVGGWENLGMIIGAVLASGTLVKIGKFAFALFTLGRAMAGLVGTLPLVAGGIGAIGSALVANPIGLVIAGIAAGAFLIWKNWEPLKGWFSGLWSEIRSTFEGFGQFVGSVFQGDFSAAVEGLKQAWSGLGDLFKRNVELMTTPLRTAFDGVIKPVMDKLGLTDPIATAWDMLRGAVGGAIEFIGQKFQGAQGFIKAVIADLLSGEAIGAAWESVRGALGSVLDWLGEKFSWLGGVIGPVISALQTVKSLGQSAVGAVGNALGVGGGGGDAPQARAVGGAFRPGWLLTGEKGPELQYQNRAGYIADARATRTLAGYAEKVASVMGGGGMAAQPATATAGATHNHYYTVNASGVSADEIVAILDRRAKQAAGAGLFDRVPNPTGMWGR